jgi:hypothetical protein
MFCLTSMETPDGNITRLDEDHAARNRQVEGHLAELRGMLKRADSGTSFDSRQWQKVMASLGNLKDLTPHQSNAQWQLQAKLGLLLPTVLLPCAVACSSQPAVVNAALDLCLTCMRTSAHMTTAAHAEGSIDAPRDQHLGVWVVEVLPLVLQQTDHWLQQAAADVEASSPPLTESMADDAEDTTPQTLAK